jgi:hypothetical protein
MRATRNGTLIKAVASAAFVLTLACLAGEARGQGAVAFQPIPSQIFDGALLNAVPVVSADRRYVRLGVSPFFSTIDGFDTFPVPAAVGGGGIAGGIGGLGGLPGGGAGGGGFRSVGPGGKANATGRVQVPGAAASAPRTIVPRSVAAAASTQPAGRSTLGLDSPAARSATAGMRRDLPAEIGPSGFERPGPGASGTSPLPGRRFVTSGNQAAAASRLGGR